MTRKGNDCRKCIQVNLFEQSKECDKLTIKCWSNISICCTINEHMNRMTQSEQPGVTKFSLFSDREKVNINYYLQMGSHMKLKVRPALIHDTRLAYNNDKIRLSHI